VVESVGVSKPSRNSLANKTSDWVFMSEIYFAPTKKAQATTVQELQQRLAEAGLPCIIEYDSPYTHWLIFERHKSTVYVSTMADHITLATFNLDPRDQVMVLEIVARVMDAIGFSADEGAEYK